MGHLLFCNRLFEGESQCNQCTKMICFDHKHSQILSRLNLTKISSSLVYAPDRTKEAFSMIMSNQLDSVLFFKSFISSQIINSSKIKEGQKKIYGINSLPANHPLLLFTSLIEMSSRICVNYLYSKITKLSRHISLPIYAPTDSNYIKLIVVIVQIGQRYYFKHFSYEGFIEMFNDVDIEDFNGSFRLINTAKKINFEDE